MSNIVKFDPKTVATVGNQFIGMILAHEMAKQDAEQALQEAEKREGFIDVELTKIALFLHNEGNIDLHDIYGDKDATMRLNRSMLTEVGVMERKVDDKTDRVLYEYTDKAIEVAYKVVKPADDAPQDVQDAYIATRSRKNALNIRLKRVMKAALSLADAKATVDDIQINEVDGKAVATITKGPKSVMGKEKSLSMDTRTSKAVEGAKFSPTITGLAKAADETHTPKTAKTADDKGKSRAEGENGTTEEDFLAMVNGTMNVIKGREGKFSKQEETVLKNLLTLVSQSVTK